MKRKILNKILIFCFAIFFILFDSTTPAYSKNFASNPKNILVINSYNDNFVWTKDIMRGINSAIDKSNVSYNLYVDYMDLKSNDTDEYIKSFYTLQKNKYKNIKFDIIICSDDDALNYLLKYRDSIFPKVPVIFCGINNLNKTLVKSENLYFGITEDISGEEMVNTISKFQPKLETINIFVGGTTTGKETTEEIKKAFINSKLKFKCNYYVDLTVDKVKEIITNSDKNTAAIFGADSMRDGFDNPKYLSTINDDFFKKTSIPLYSFWDIDLNYGAVGGKLISGFNQGDAAGKLAIKFLDGEKIDSVITNNNKYIFDYNKLKQFKIESKNLPKDSVIINRQFSFFETYKILVLKTLFVMLFLLAIIIILVIFSKRKIESEKKINSSYEELASVYEELAATEEELRSQFDELQDNKEKIQNMAFYDSLTNLPNRVLFMEKLKEALNNSLNCNSRGAVFFLDLDEFKKINDTVGHQNGDELLVIVSGKLKLLLEDYGIISRFGGDEFLILIPKIEDYYDIVNLLDRIVDIFSKPIIFNSISNYITASIGITFFPDHGKDANIILKDADTAMYRAKEDGKNQYCFFNQIMSEKILRDNDVENNLRDAVKNNELIMYYQPQIDIQSREVIGMEALVRWNSKNLGFVMPNSFIPIAEKTGLIFEIGSWIFENVCNQIKIWKSKNYKFNYIAINISPIQIKQPSFLDKVSKVIKSLDLPTNLIELEITENVLLDSIDANLNKLNILNSLGIKIALDDFGTGFSSLNYLRILPINTLKIDKSFIDGICNNKEQNLITNGIIQLSHKLNYKVIAEGVETEEQLNVLNKMDCDYIQGYYFSKPVSSEKMEGMLKRNK